MSVSSDSDIVMLPGVSGLNPGSYALRRAPPYRIQKEIRPRTWPIVFIDGDGSLTHYDE